MAGRGKAAPGDGACPPPRRGGQTVNRIQGRQQKKQKALSDRQQANRNARMVRADRIITRFLDAYQAANGAATVVTYNGNTGRYRWNGRNLTTAAIRSLTDTLEADAAGLLNPDEENS